MEMQYDEERLLHENERGFDENNEEERYLEIEEQSNTEFQSVLDDGYFYKEQQSESLIMINNNEQDGGVDQISLVAYLAKTCPIKHVKQNIILKKRLDFLFFFFKSTYIEFFLDFEK